MSNFTALTVDEIFRLPPMIFGTIRWKKSLGKPVGTLCSGFGFLVEEHTATQYADAGGGEFAPIPGTGLWKVISDAVSCQAGSDDGDYHVLRFQVTGLHFNAPLDGFYRITPSVIGNWGSSSIFATFLGFRAVDPISYDVVLTREKPVQAIQFEVIRRSFFSGNRLP